MYWLGLTSAVRVWRVRSDLAVAAAAAEAAEL